MQHSETGPDQPAPAPKQDHAALALAALCTQHGDLAGLRILSALRQRPGREVHQVTWQGQRAILKRFRGPDAAARVRAMQAELAHLQGWMDTGPYQAATCLHASPAAGVIILRHVPGQRQSKALAEAQPGAQAGAQAGAGPATRAHLVSATGHWLVLMGRGRTRVARFAPLHWVRLLRAALRNMGDSHLEPGLALLHARMRDLAPALRGAGVLHGAVHGDLAPPNLIWDGQVLTGIDIGGQCLQPLARDVARYLVWLQTTCPIETSPAKGVGTADLAAMAQSGVLRGDDPRTLDFFIAEQMARRLAHLRGRPKLAENARAAISGLTD